MLFAMYFKMFSWNEEIAEVCQMCYLGDMEKIVHEKNYYGRGKNEELKLNYWNTVLKYCGSLVCQLR